MGCWCDRQQLYCFSTRLAPLSIGLSYWALERFIWDINIICLMSLIVCSERSKEIFKVAAFYQYLASSVTQTVLNKMVLIVLPYRILSFKYPIPSAIHESQNEREMSKSRPVDLLVRLHIAFYWKQLTDGLKEINWLGVSQLMCLNWSPPIAINGCQRIDKFHHNEAHFSLNY